MIDVTNPKLLKIGENVRITRGVVILTHDFSWPVLAGVYGECLGGVAPVTIGNNVFIGMDAHIMRGVEIGDNVIIGAGSLVTHNCDSNSVYAGNPARKIMTLQEFYQKKKQSYLKNAETIARIYSDCSLDEQRAVLREHCGLFCGGEEEALITSMEDTGYRQVCATFYKDRKPRFSGIEDFLNTCGHISKVDERKNGHEK